MSATDALMMPMPPVNTKNPMKPQSTYSIISIYTVHTCDITLTLPLISERNRSAHKSGTHPDASHCVLTPFLVRCSSARSSLSPPDDQFDRAGLCPRGRAL